MPDAMVEVRPRVPKMIMLPALENSLDEGGECGLWSSCQSHCGTPYRSHEGLSMLSVTKWTIVSLDDRNHPRRAEISPGLPSG